MKKVVKKGLTAEHPLIAKKIDKSLKLSIKEGSVASISSGFGYSYLSPFALAMNATSSQVGILYAITNLFPSLVQLYSPKLLEFFSRKKIMLFGLMIRILLWIPIILTGFLFYRGVSYAIWIMIALSSLLYGMTAITHPAWFSWMGSLVPTDTRGIYFSKRNRVSGFFGLITMIVGAIILDFSKKVGASSGNLLAYTLIGFGILFALASLFRIWSWTLLARQYEPKLKIRRKDYFSFWEFLKRTPSNAFGRFTLFRFFFGIGIGISGPFWAIYMLRDLGFSYMWFMAITVSGILFQLIFLPVLGKVSDKFGNVKLIKISSWLIFTIPVIWFLSSLIENEFYVRIYLLILPSIIAGFAWAGYNLATNNYVYEVVSQQKRAFGVSYMNLLLGLGTFIGASIGSLIAFVGVPFMNTILFIFLISAVGRLAVSLFGLRYLKEVRNVEKFSSEFLIREFRPVDGIIQDIHHLEHLVNRTEHHI